MLIHLCIVHGCFHTIALEELQQRPFVYKTRTFLFWPFTEKSLLAHSLYEQNEGYGYMCTFRCPANIILKLIVSNFFTI